MMMQFENYDKDLSLVDNLLVFEGRRLSELIGNNREIKAKFLNDS
jgi:hypothetical protein